MVRLSFPLPWKSSFKTFSLASNFKLLWLLSLVVTVQLFIVIGRKYHNIPPDVTYNATQILDNADFEGALKCKNDVKFLVAVATSPAHFEAREAFRQIYSGIDEWRMVFFIGHHTVTDPKFQKRLDAESESHGDMVQANFMDTYNNLTIKSLLLLKWTMDKCPRAKYVLKLDDDVYMNVRNMQTLTRCLDNSLDFQRDHNSTNCERWDTRDTTNYFVDHLKKQTVAYIAGGYLYKHVAPDRQPASKWYLSPTLYPYHVLPNYLAGISYLLSANIIPLVLEMAPTVPVIQLEDVYVTGLLLTRTLKFRLAHIDGWNNFRPILDNACLYRQSLTMHGLYPQELIALDNKVKNLKHSDCQGLSAMVSDLVKFVSYYIPSIKN